MSRTDVHRPWWVQQHDPANRHRLGVVTHHHVVRDCWDEQTRRWLVEHLAPCDLDDSPADRERSGYRCNRWPVYNMCGCPMCTGHHSRKLSRRQHRAALRAQLRAALKTAPADRGDIDIPSPKRLDGWIAWR